jgi:putative ABC transport system permease protein
MDAFLQDLRYAVRTLRRSPLLTALAVLCLSLGIGANVSQFSIVHATLVAPLPFEDGDALVDVWTAQPASGQRSTVSYPDFLDWAREARSFAALAAVSSRSFALGGGAEPERVQGAAVSAGLFTMLGTRPVLGRDIGPADDRPGAPRVLLLTDDLWRRRYGADPRIVGRTVPVNDRPHEVIGVLPPRVRFPFQQLAYVALAPVADPGTRVDRPLEVFGRLAPTVSIDAARSEMTAIAARLASVHPENKEWGAIVRPLRDYFAPPDVRLVTLTALGAVTMILVIACANVASLLLARASGRRREMSLRAALGAGHRRLVRQLLTEALVLGLISVPAGVAFADLGVTLIAAAIPADDIPYLIDFGLSRTVLAYAVLVAVGSSLVFGLAPAWHSARVDLVSALRDGGRSGNAWSRTPARSALVVVEVALSLVLLVGASLFVRSFLNMQRTSPGFDAAPLLTLRLYLPGQGYAEPGAKARRVADVVERIEAVPGVIAAGASNLIPLDGGGGGSRLTVEGRDVPAGSEGVFWAGLTPRYWEALGVPMLKGRALTRTEAETRSAVAVVNVSFVRRFLSREGAPPRQAGFGHGRLRGAADLGALDPIGRRLRLLDAPDAPWFTVVGVVADVMTEEMDSNPEQPAVFVGYPHQEAANTGLVVRGAGDPAALAAAVRAAVHASDPTLPVFSVMTMEELRRRGLWQFQLFGWMFSIFGALALVLGSAGVYGVLSHAVSLRTPEFGVRMALGATAGDVLRLTVRQGFRLIAAGVVLGLAGAAATTRLVGTLLFGVTPTDPASFALVVLVLTAVGALACYLPARRAARVDPMVTLRSE